MDIARQKRRVYSVYRGVVTIGNLEKIRHDNGVSPFVVGVTCACGFLQNVKPQAYIKN
jgi:hypothetical protein